MAESTLSDLSKRLDAEDTRKAAIEELAFKLAHVVGADIPPLIAELDSSDVVTKAIRVAREESARMDSPEALKTVQCALGALVNLALRF